MNKQIVSLLLVAFFMLRLLAVTDGWEYKSTSNSVDSMGKILWREGFSGEHPEERFNIEFFDGAKGEVKFESVNGVHCLRVIKTNHVGFIVISPKSVFTCPIGTKLQGRISVQCLSAVPEYSLGFIQMRGVQGQFFCNKNYLEGDFAGGLKMKYLTHRTPENNDFKLCHVQADEFNQGEIIPGIIVAGAPSDSLWSDWRIEDYDSAQNAWREYSKKRPMGDFSGDMIPAEEFEKQLKLDFEHTAKIEIRDNKSTLLIDGKERTPVLFKSKASRNLKKITFAGKTLQNVGIDLQVTTVRFGHCPLADGFWTSKGFDAKGAAELVRKAMRASDKCLFVISVETDAYPEFSLEHPEETWKFADGETVWGSYVHMRPRNLKHVTRNYWPWISNHSLVWREAVKNNITAFVDELKRSGLSKRIVGIHIAGYHDHQFSTPTLDYSKPAIAGFRRYLKEKYKTDVALRKAWNQNNITFATVEAPKFNSTDFLLPEKKQAQIDFFRFLKHAPFQTEEYFAHHFRKCFGKDIICLRWCQAAHDGYYVGAYDITPFVMSKEIDVLVAQTSYQRRTPGLANGMRMPLNSFHLHKKLFINELDLRTYGAIIGNERELTQIYLGAAVDLPMWQSLYRRLSGQMIARNMGYWFYDMAGGWFAPKEITADIGDSVKTMVNIPKDKHCWQPSVAFVIDEDGMMLRNLPYHGTMYESLHLVPTQMQIMPNAAVPYDIWLADDFIRNPELAKKYQMVIFSGMNHIDKLRQKMLDSIKNNNRTLVFLAGTGCVGGCKKGTGFDLQEIPAEANHEIVAINDNGINVMSMMYNSLAPIRFRLLGKEYNPRIFSVVETPDAEILARYRKSNKPAIAKKNFKDYKSIYICDAAGLTPELFNHLASEAKCYVPTHPGLQVEMNGTFIMVHCIIPGKYEFKLPFNCTVKNLKSSANVPVNNQIIKLELTAGETCWFGLY